MCGICGFTISTDSQAEQKSSQRIVDAMCDSIKHRGPDGAGRVVTDDIAFGHRRLSLVDLEGGAQPMARANKDSATITFTDGESELSSMTSNGYAIVFNGEIYNYKDLREELEFKGYSFTTKSDTEVLLVSYIEYGESCLDMLRGMFAFAIWDSTKKEIFCARDPFGIKPFYYVVADDGAFVFASEIKALLQYPAVKKKLNITALEPYMSFQYSALNETFFKGIYKLAPGHMIRVNDNGDVKLKRWWISNYDIDDTLAQDGSDVEDIISDAIKDSVAYHMIADVEVGSFLSSGVDSNYLAASLNEQGENIKTFTVGFDEDGRKYNEIDYASAAAKWMGVENISHVITKDEFWEDFPKIQYHMDEPLADPAAAALWFVDKEAAKHVKAVLSGEGADELFGGYPIYQTTIANMALDKVPNGMLRLASKAMSRLGLRGANYLHRASTPIEERFIGNAYIFGDDERYEYLIDQDEFSHESVADIVKDTFSQVKELDETTKMQYVDLNHWMVGDILLKTDKMSMAHSLESRVPFLDKKVWSVARTLPLGCKVSADETKMALRKAAKKTMPQQFCEKPKLGFPVPIRIWLRQDDCYAKVKEAFESDVARQYFDINKTVKLLDDHREGKVDNSRKIWTIYSFLVWYDQYFNERE